MKVPVERSVTMSRCTALVTPREQVDKAMQRGGGRERRGGGGGEEWEGEERAGEGKNE